jgi:para-nitrobenzyl esterase
MDRENKPAGAPVADTTHGRVRGEYIGGAAVFRGIPYGASCAGPGRFMPPQPAKDWEGVRACIHNPPLCWQPGASVGNIPGTPGDYNCGGRRRIFHFTMPEYMDEDCLTVNINTPAVDGKRRPVLVYIHGGGFSDGSGMIVVGADRFTLENDLVLVGVNHRLNAFGYLYLGALDAAYASSGTVGMLDLVLALTWVRDNIEAFGGDPDHVTIMGESGGGMKISTLLAMPQAQGLFQRAIVESGSGPAGVVSAQAAAEQTLALLDAMGIDRENWREILTYAPYSIIKALKTHPIRLQPVGDDLHLPFNPTGDFRSPPTARDVAIVVGSSEDEWANMYSRWPDHETFSMTRQTLRDYLLNWPMERMNDGVKTVCSPENVDAVIDALYTTGTPGLDAVDQYFRAFVMMRMGGGAFHEAMAYASDSLRTKPVYHYLNTYDATYPRMPQRKGAWHTADLPLQFRLVYYPYMEEMSKRFAGALAAFVRSGNPTFGDIPWPEYQPDSRLTFIFDECCRVESDPRRKLREALEGK